MNFVTVSRVCIMSVWLYRTDQTVMEAFYLNRKDMVRPRSILGSRMRSTDCYSGL